MKSTIVDSEGNVRCPVCGANDFSDKRTGRATMAGLPFGALGIAAMPKRLKCRGCGENLKRGGKPSERARIETPKRTVKVEETEPYRENRKAADLPDRPPRDAFRRQR